MDGFCECPHGPTQSFCRTARRFSARSGSNCRTDRDRPALFLARSGPRQRHAGQFAAVAGSARRQPHRSACGQIRRGHAAVFGHAARRFCVLAAQCGLSKRRISLLFGQCRTGGAGLQPARLRLGQQACLSGRHAIRFYAGRPAPGQLARARRAAQRCAHHRPAQSQRSGGHGLHQRHHRPQQRRHAQPRQFAEQCPSA